GGLESGSERRDRLPRWRRERRAGQENGSAARGGCGALPRGTELDEEGERTRSCLFYAALCLLPTALPGLGSTGSPAGADVVDGAALLTALLEGSRGKELDGSLLGYR